METRSHHNHNQREYALEVDRLPDDAIFSTVRSTPAMFNHRPSAIDGAIPCHPEGADQPQPKRGRAMLIPTVLCHVLQIVQVAEVY